MRQRVVFVLAGGSTMEDFRDFRVDIEDSIIGVRKRKLRLMLPLLKAP